MSSHPLDALREAWERATWAHLQSPNDLDLHRKALDAWQEYRVAMRHAGAEAVVVVTDREALQ